MKITVQQPKPRNPVAVQARRRLAGAHGLSTGARRQRDRRELRAELARQHPPHVPV